MIAVRWSRACWPVLHWRFRVDRGAQLDLMQVSSAKSPLHDLTGVALQVQYEESKIRNFVHKSLRRLYVEDSANMRDPEVLRASPLWKAHRLTGSARTRRPTFPVTRPCALNRHLASEWTSSCGYKTLMHDIAKARKRAKAIHVERYKPRNAA